MNKKTLPTIKRETIDIDEIYVTQHSVIETVKKILMENKGNYVPMDSKIRGVSPQEDKITGKKGYKVNIDVLEILYGINNDVVRISLQEGQDISQTDIRLAVGQANMILCITQQKSQAQITTLLQGDGSKDIIIIQQASKLIP